MNSNILKRFRTAVIFMINILHWLKALFSYFFVFCIENYVWFRKIAVNKHRSLVFTLSFIWIYSFWIHNRFERYAIMLHPSGYIKLLFFGIYFLQTNYSVRKYLQMHLRIYTRISNYKIFFCFSIVRWIKTKSSLPHEIAHTIELFHIQWVPGLLTE